MRSCWLQLFSCLAVVLCAHGYVLNEPSNQLNLIHEPWTAQQLRERYAKNPQMPRQREIGGSKYWMTNYPKDTYLVEHDIGSPDYTFKLNIETGGQYLWVIHKYYANVTSNVQRYDPAKSRTSEFIGPTTHTYTGTLEVEGEKYKDEVLIVGHKVWKQEFIAVSKTHPAANESNVFSIDGAMGLSWDALEDKTKPTAKSSPIFNLLKRYKAKKQVFSVWLPRTPTKTAQGSLTIGKLNTDKCKNDYTWVPLTPSNKLFAPLAFQVDGFQFSDYKTKKSGLAKVDSGLSVLILPADQYNIVTRKINPQFDDNLHILVANCSSRSNFPPLVYNIGQAIFSVDSNDYIKDVGIGNGLCAVTIDVAVEPDVPWGFGTPFLRNFCQHFDIAKQQLGLSLSL